MWTKVFLIYVNFKVGHYHCLLELAHDASQLELFRFILDTGRIFEGFKNKKSYITNTGML